jgi:hypothetical protein
MISPNSDGPGGEGRDHQQNSYQAPSAYASVDPIATTPVLAQGTVALVSDLLRDIGDWVVARQLDHGSSLEEALEVRAKYLRAEVVNILRELGAGGDR